MESSKPAMQSNEIDVGQLFQSIVRGIKNLGRSMVSSIAVLRRQFLTNFIFFIVIIGLGVSSALAYSTFMSKRYYTSSMIIRCSYINMAIMKNTIDKLNLLCEEKDRKGLSEVLGIGLNVASNIRRFDAKNFVSEDDKIEIEVLRGQLNSVVENKREIVDRVIEKIEIENSQAFQINVSVFSPDIVQSMDSTLVQYFKNNGFISRRMVRNRESLLERREKLVDESKKLDSLKSILYANFQTMSKQSREGSNNVILSDKYLTDPLNVFKEDLNLNNEIRSIDDQLKLQSDFEVVDGLTTFREPANFSLPILIVSSVFYSIILGYTLLGIWSFNKHLANIG